MGVKHGYKQTEVGMIPETWEVRPLGSFAQLKNGYAFKSSEYTAFGSFSVVTIANVQDGYMDVADCNKISDLPRDLQPHHRLQFGDILISMTGNVGRVCRVTASNCLLNQRVGKLVPSGIDAVFLSLLLGQRRFLTAMSGKAKGGAQGNLSVSDILDFPFPLPSTKAEQEAIANALSDADALIESLEQLVAKKRQIKHGAMQELLTGKRRLPGFRGEWELRRLDELGRWTGGMTPAMRNQDYWGNGTVPWISSGDVKSPRLMSTAFAISEYAVKQRAATLLPAKSIIVVTRSGILRKFLPVSMNMIPMTINQDIKALLPNQLALAEYLLHSLTYHGDQILSRCLKSGTTVESIEFPWLKAFTIPIPQLPEQTAIATILSDMDAEIAAQEAKLAKARLIKQGMMQELLTGRIRLV